MSYDKKTRSGASPGPHTGPPLPRPSAWHPRARCPIHSGTNPTSFSVEKERYLWHCFSCGESGNSLTYLRRMSGLSFLEALEQLCDAVGIEIPDARGKSADRSEARVLHEFARLARRWFRGPEGKDARRFLTVQRGFPEAILDTLGLGYVTEIEEVRKGMRAAGCDTDLAGDLGLLHIEWRTPIVGFWRGWRGELGSIWGRAVDSRSPKYFYHPGSARSKLPPFGMAASSKDGASGRSLMFRPWRG
ncbi:MAG: hypothetical protein IH962_00380, partial [Chloroflexi bacterium]|nr:hypothetical protein [Chloroflexota bacterium]